MLAITHYGGQRFVRERWRIETFFRALKQNLRIKSFVGTSKNALATQIYCALIAMLLLAFLKHHAKYGWTLSNLVALLRQQLLVCRGLWMWIDEPFQTPEVLVAVGPMQMPLNL